MWRASTLGRIKKSANPPKLPVACVRAAGLRQLSHPTLALFSLNVLYFGGALSEDKINLDNFEPLALRRQLHGRVLGRSIGTV